VVVGPSSQLDTMTSPIPRSCQRTVQMDRSRKENREDRERTFQYKSRQEALLDDELTEDKLSQLLSFLQKLKDTPEGSAEIQRRVKVFGECERSDGET